MYLCVPRVTEYCTCVVIHWLNTVHVYLQVTACVLSLCGSTVTISTVPVWDHSDRVLIDWMMIAYIALFSALLSRLTALACGSTWVTSFIARFCFVLFCFVEYPPKWCTLQRWHGWCHMKLQPSRRKSCVHHTTMHHVTSCKATYVRCMRV